MVVESGRLVVAFDTASENIALAVGRWDEGGSGLADGGSLAGGSLAGGMRLEMLAADDHPALREANVQLVPSVVGLFKAHGLRRKDVGCVVCGLGPGSFTGVRIGVATAKGMARGLGVPLFGVCTLDAIAWEAWACGLRGRVGVVADAMRGEVYPARFELGEGGVLRLDAHSVATADVVAGQWQQAGERLVVIGDGLKKFRAAFAGADEPAAGPECVFELGDVGLWTPRGRGLLLAFEAACASASQGSGEAGAVLPVYTRLSDAEENERKRLAAGGQIAQGALVEVPKSGVAPLGAVAAVEPEATGQPETAEQPEQPGQPEAAGQLGQPALLGAVVYRPMASVDLEQVSLLEAGLFAGGSAVSGECWSQQMFAQELGLRDRSWWVAYVGDALVGFAGGMMVDGARAVLAGAGGAGGAGGAAQGEMQVLDIAVAQAYRRRGIARALLGRLIEDGKSLGVQKATLEVRESNKTAQALYVSAGFCVVGTRPGYYASTAGGAREAAVIMEKQLVGKAPTASPPVILSEGAKGTVVEGSNRGCGNNGATASFEQINSNGHPKPLILAIETSCDETAAAVIDGSGKLLADTVASQVDFHARFGGVVPEIASRKHTEAIVGVVDAAMEDAGLNPFGDLDGIAVTYAPGLIGALVVGVAFAKGLAWACDLPLVRVNHLEGHIYANRLAVGEAGVEVAAAVEATVAAAAPVTAAAPAAQPSPLEPPFVIALLSGGHTMLVHARAWGDYRILGQTLDDAVGEAFDKIAKALGLGYPGGPVISRLALQGDPAAISFPRALLHSHDYRFSLSGLKTAVITYIKAEQAAGRTLDLPNIAASFQQAVIDVQVAKALAALEQTGCTTFCLGGGVAANRALRNAYIAAMTSKNIRVVLPPPSACTDNAAMIALVALDRYRQGRFMSLADDAFAQSNLEESY